MDRSYFDRKSLLEMEELSKEYRFNIDGEGGEYETLVVAGPHLEGELKVWVLVDGMELEAN